jgi:ElaB/YqjD/DUF883 family membrane-anchored ribosome-binding protein
MNDDTIAEVRDALQDDSLAVLKSLRRYATDNPLAMVAGAAIIGMLLARFAFLGNPRD